LPPRSRAISTSGNSSPRARRARLVARPSWAPAGAHLVDEVAHAPAQAVHLVDEVQDDRDAFVVDAEVLAQVADQLRAGEIDVASRLNSAAGISGSFLISSASGQYLVFTFAEAFLCDVPRMDLLSHFLQFPTLGNWYRLVRLRKG
jgi:hypothetical protein